MASSMPPSRGGGNTVDVTREMKLKANTQCHSKLGRLADVAARFECAECMEEELVKVADGKGSEDKLLTCAEWEAYGKPPNNGQPRRAS